MWRLVWWDQAWPFLSPTANWTWVHGKASGCVSIETTQVSNAPGFSNMDVLPANQMPCLKSFVENVFIHRSVHPPLNMPVCSITLEIFFKILSNLTGTFFWGTCLTDRFHYWKKRGDYLLHTSLNMHMMAQSMTLAFYAFTSLILKLLES